MKRLLAVGAVAVLATVTMTAPSASFTATPSKANPACTSRLFRNVARQVTHPWYEKAHGRYRMRRLVGCAANERTRRQMKRIRENQEAGKAEAVQNFRELTPYRCGSIRVAIPGWVTYRESRCDWNAVNSSSGAITIYQFLGHSEPLRHWPIDSFEDKMAMHRYARWLWNETDGQAWAVY